MIELLKEAIESLEHAEIFIDSRQKMHKDGVALHQETISKLSDELEKLEVIANFEKSAMEHYENQLKQREPDQKKSQR